jgi:uncharacterized protein (DUF885 family)
MSRIYEIADKYVDELVALDPSLATALGIPGHEREMTDYSPDGVGAVAALNRRTASALDAAPADGERDRIARDVMLERLGVRLDLFDAGEQFRELRIIASPLQGIRSVFDQMPKDTEEQWSNIAARLRLVPAALAGYRQTLSEGLQKGETASQRQARETLQQAEIWSGQAAGKQSFFDMLLETYRTWEVRASLVLREEGALSPGLSVDLAEGVAAAVEGYAEMARWLREEYLPRAGEREAAGPERYGLMSRVFLGAEIDPLETYKWGWEELYRLEREMETTAEKIVPGGSIDAAKELLETDHARSLDGVEAFKAWLQEVHDEAVESVDGTHFDIDPRIRRMEVMIPPPGGALAPYYTGPSEDFTRPGRTWWPLGTRTRFPKWMEVSTAYHEGVPGHHLQVGSARALGDKLSRFQRLLTFVSGYGEGWALYAERLMGELGYLGNPDYYLGMLSAQALRAVRVIVDIGMHLELKIPASEKFHPGEVWNHDLALAFAIERSRWPAEMLASEIVRYLGWPAQAISYKVGERKWLETREAAKRREGGAFDLKRFHTEALELGPMGLAQLEKEMGG